MWLYFYIAYTLAFFVFLSLLQFAVIWPQATLLSLVWTEVSVSSLLVNQAVWNLPQCCTRGTLRPPASATDLGVARSTPE